MIALLLPLAPADPVGLPTWTAYPAIFLLITGITWIVRWSITGTITWPPEKKRMQDTIDLLVGELQKTNAETQRVLPATTRLVEVIQQDREPEPRVKISRADLVAALREVTVETKKVIPDE